MADRQNRRRHTQFVELVGLVLESNGVSAPRTKRPAKLSDRLGPDARLSAFDVPTWSIRVSSALKLDLSSALDAAERDGRLDDSKFSAVVAYRRGRPTSDAYAIVTLATLGRLIKATQAERAEDA